DGLHRFSYRDAQVLEHILIEENTNFVLCIYVDEQEDVVWFSTQDGGLHRIKNGQRTSFTTQDGLFNDNTFQILDDGQGNLWLTSSLGLSVINKKELDRYAEGLLETLTPTVYRGGDGLKSQEFIGGIQPAGWRSADGRLWFPTVGGGVSSIDPSAIRVNEHPPPVHIEQAMANDEAIPLVGQATLPPGHNRFEFHYVGLSLLAPEQVQYRYKLEGFDEDWKEAGTMREASYTNLAPGAYTFKVIARNNDGVWSEEAATVSFYLQPYFYQTGWFYVLCVVSLALLIFVFYRLRIRHLKRRERELVELVEVRTSDLRQEKERSEEALLETDKAWREAQRQKEIVEDAKAVIEEQAEKLQEMDQIKTRFFNNISHEFRTPLTLNIGPLENALQGIYGPVTGEMKRQLEVMLRNSRLLLRLINQLLDVAKLESGKMGIRVRHGNLVELLEGIVLSFTAFAEQKALTVDFSSQHKDLTLNFDPNHLEKVFFNLLSNAVKFTPKNGRIAVSVVDGEVGAHGVEGETVIIRFKDTGLGIPAEALPYIFDRFHQVDGTISRVQEGTGIGLSLVKELVELHGGTIRVESEDGVGTEFIVTLPKDTRRLDDYAEEFDEFEAFEAEDEESARLTASVSESPMVEMAVFDDEEATAEPSLAPLLPPETPTILVVDDNPEIRAYVTGCLKQSYHVAKAVDGQDALDKVRVTQPDLIISDVMMPNMDGYELCRAIKSDERLSHIPVIILTSRASLDEKIKGLEAGSDDYLTKPFSARELLVRTRNLLHLGLQKKELKALNDAFKQTNEELREASQMKSQLLRIAAHDLKNPLNGIREFAKILKEELDPDGPHQELLDLIHTSSDQMLTMVSELLDSEALESGELILNIEPVSIGTIAEEVVRRNRPQAQRKDERLILHLDQNDPCLVEGSSEWLRAAMDNLVSNAVKYSPFGKNIWVTAERRGPVVRFAVRDEGPGLTEDDKERLFGKFQRLSALPTNNESSTGLGLSIVKQIVEMHHGKVWAESEEGQGSTFIIELTCAEPTSPDEVLPPARRESRDRIPPPHGRRTDSGLPAERD
ncbi:MAG: ATP-binding protein, partial [Rhodothermales bacterium]